MTRTSLVKVGAALAVAGVASFMLFSPWGIHLYGEVLFPEDEPKAYAATDHPTPVTEVAVARTIPLPSSVMQPSGIDYDAATDRFFIVTDQAEIIELSGDLRTVVASTVMSNMPLFFRQGTIESNDYHQGDLYVSGDLGRVEIWTRNDETWERVGEIESPGTVNVSSEGMAVDPETGEIYMGNDHEIHVLDGAGTYLRTLELKAEPKSGRSVSEYIIAGLDFHDGDLYVLSEYYSAVLTVDPQTGEVAETRGLDGIVEGAGLAVTDEAFFVVVDHELNEPSPGVKVYRR